MTRLLLVDALRRYGTGLAVVLLAGGWLWRSLPPWAIRDAWWRLGPGLAVTSLLAALFGYVGLTAPIVRLLVSSERLEYWRQFPIPPREWTRLRRMHLAALHAPVGIAVAYLLAPGGVVLAGLGTAVALAAVIGSGRRVGRARNAPRMRTRLVARARVTVLARLLAQAWWRRQRMHGRAVLAAQVGLLGFAALGAAHVASVEPEAGPPLVGTLAVVAAMVAGSTILVAVRAVDRDRWFLDTLSVEPGLELWARLVLGGLAGLPTITGTVIAAALLEQGWWGTGLALCVVVWAAASGARIAAAAEARRDLHRSRPAVFVLRLAYGLALVHILGPIALGIAAIVEAMLARRALVTAAATRARFETTTVEDDHG